MVTCLQRYNIHNYTQYISTKRHMRNQSDPTYAGTVRYSSVRVQYTAHHQLPPPQCPSSSSGSGAVQVVQLQAHTVHRRSSTTARVQQHVLQPKAEVASLDGEESLHRIPVPTAAAEEEEWRRGAIVHIPEYPPNCTGRWGGSSQAAGGAEAVHSGIPPRGQRGLDQLVPHLPDIMG